MILEYAVVKADAIENLAAAVDDDAVVLVFYAVPAVCFVVSVGDAVDRADVGSVPGAVDGDSVALFLPAVAALFFAVAPAVVYFAVDLAAAAAAVDYLADSGFVGVVVDQVAAVEIRVFVVRGEVVPPPKLHSSIFLSSSDARVGVSASLLALLLFLLHLLFSGPEAY